LNDAALADCRMGLMRRRQAAYALARLANTSSWSEETIPAIQAIVQRYTDLAEEAEDNLRMILKWAELPS